MATVPVVQTATAACEFSIKNYFRILGVIWVPMALMWLMMAASLVPAMAQIAAAQASKDPAAILGSLGGIFLAEAVALVLVVSMSAGITEVALGRTIRFPYFHLSIGAAFWRLLLSDFILALIMFVALFAVSITMGIVVGIIAASTAGAAADPTQIAAQVNKMAVLMAIPIYGAMLFILVRFGILLPSISIVERRIGIGRNWSLTKGNSWRICGAFVLILIPWIVIGFGFAFLLGAIGGPAMNMFAYVGNPQAQMAVSMNILHLYVTYWYVLLAVTLLLSPILYGALFGAGAFVYRALVPEAVPADTF